jgi:transposase
MKEADMRYVRAVRKEEHAELDRMTKQEIGRVAMRANMIQLSSQGYSVPTIATIHKTTKVTVYKWFDRFDKEGPSGLYDNPRTGRPKKATQKVKTFLENSMEQNPISYGINCTLWTVSLLQTYLQEKRSVHLSHTTLRETLHSLGFRWRRPRWAAVRQDPLKAQRMKEIANVVLKKIAEVKVWLQDETKFRTLPPLRQMWMRKGQQVRIPTPETNDKFYSYGVMNLDDGDWFDAFFERVNSDTTIAFLEAFLQVYPNEQHILIWDQARYHLSKKVKEWLHAEERVSVLLLPKYAAELNPVESIWRIVKQRIAANLTRTLDALKAAYRTFFGENSANDLLRFAGLAL